MKYGYARVSKKEQSLDVQIEKLRQAGCDEIFQEKVSGAIDSRKELNALLSKLQKGDTLYVVRLDRLGRRMAQLIELINDFKNKGIEFISLENNIDTTTPMGMILFNMVASFAEMERIILIERIKAGVENSRKNGTKNGRPQKLDNKQLKLLQSISKTRKVSVKEVCKLFGIGSSTYYRLLSS